MSADQEYAGDYGYDLAHEVSVAVDTCSPRPRTVRAATFHAARPEADANGDLGYDSAHEG